jgi:glycosyltransferase involved in cell wall biosynthesis
VNGVSVVIPYYRASQTIARALRSLVTQTAPPDEILVIDDGSPDDAAGAIKEFASSVKLLRKPNGGAASARNMGIDHARGTWIAFLDADDYWDSNKLERQMAVSDGVGLVGGRWYTEYPGRPRYIAPIPRTDFYGRLMEPRGSDAFHVAMHCWTGTLLVRRDVLGDHRFVSGLEPAEDRDLWIRLAASTSVFLIAEPLATYVQYDNSLSNSDADRDCGNMLKVVRRHAALLGKKGRREQEAIVYCRWAGCQLARGKPRSAIAPAAHQLTINPDSLQAWWILAKALGMSMLP